MKNEIEIDMVFLYVDGNEQEFQKKKNKYLAKAGKKTKELNERVNDLNKTKTAIINMMEDISEANEDLKSIDKSNV